METTNFFENVKFGDKFVLKNKIIAIYIRKSYNNDSQYMLGWEENGEYYEELYSIDGKLKHEPEYDIDHKYQYIINNEYVDDLAKAYYTNEIEQPAIKKNEVDGYGYPKVTPLQVYNAFKAGYSEGINEMQNELETANMQYVSQMSMWISKYNQLKKEFDKIRQENKTMD